MIVHSNGHSISENQFRTTNNTVDITISHFSHHSPARSAGLQSIPLWSSPGATLYPALCSGRLEARPQPRFPWPPRAPHRRGSPTRLAARDSLPLPCARLPTPPTLYPALCGGCLGARPQPRLPRPPRALPRRLPPGSLSPHQPLSSPRLPHARSAWCPPETRAENLDSRLVVKCLFMKWRYLETKLWSCIWQKA